MVFQRNSSSAVREASDPHDVSQSGHVRQDLHTTGGSHTKGQADTQRCLPF